MRILSRLHFAIPFMEILNAQNRISSVIEILVINLLKGF